MPDGYLAIISRVDFQSPVRLDERHFAETTSRANESRRYFFYGPGISAGEQIGRENILRYPPLRSRCFTSRGTLSRSDYTALK